MSKPCTTSVGDVTCREDHSQVRAGNGPQVMAMLRNLAIAIMKLAGDASIAATTRHYARNASGPGRPRAHRGMTKDGD